MATKKKSPSHRNKRPTSTGKAARQAAARERNRGLRMAAVRADIARPLGRSWDELGRDLRGLRAQAHHCINNAAFTAELARRDKKYGIPQTAAYEASKEASAGFRKWVRKHKDPQVNAKDVAPGGGVLSAWGTKGNDAVTRWHKDEKEGRPGRLPTVKSGAPIMVRRAEWFLVERDGLLVLSARLIAGKEGPRHEMVLSAFAGANWATLRGIAKGEVEAGALQIMYEPKARRKDGKRGQWCVKITFKREKPAIKEGGGTLIVHRGQHNFLYLLPSTGMSRGVAIKGTNVRAQKLAWEGRARDIQRGMNDAELGKGARGHGRKRRYGTLDACRDRCAEILRTLCQQEAVSIAKHAIQWGCTSVAIEDYGGIQPREKREERRFMQRFPLYLLKQCIARVCEGAGLSLVEVPSMYISTKCPRCETIEASQHNQRTGVFHCHGECPDFSELADSVAAYWMLCAVYPDGNTPAQKTRKHEAEMVKRLQKSLAEMPADDVQPPEPGTNDDGPLDTPVVAVAPNAPKGETAEEPLDTPAAAE